MGMAGEAAMRVCDVRVRVTAQGASGDFSQE